MAEYERSRFVRVSPDDVLPFVTNFENIPNFVPTVIAVEPLEEEGRARVRGEFRGTPYTDVIVYHIDEDRRRVEWGSDERAYYGVLTVSPAEGGAQIVVQFSVPPYVGRSGEPITGELSDGDDPYEEGLETALDSLRNLLEGTGGEEEPDIAL